MNIIKPDFNGKWIAPSGDSFDTEKELKAFIRGVQYARDTIANKMDITIDNFEQYSGRDNA